MKRIISLMALLFLAPVIPAQTQTQQKSKDQSPGIQDNSFLIEEAYNQEDGVVQHINSFMLQRNRDWIYAFTQEWPFFGSKHQLSYTIPVQRMGSAPDGGKGLGDVALNYRYQLIGDGKSRIACSPRFSLLLPTGDEKKGLGAGGLGLQVNVPVSVLLTKKLVTHINAGATYTPSAKSAGGDEDNTMGYNLGESFIWLATPTFNVMLETVWNRVETVVGPNLKERDYSLLISPGIRWAYNFENGLQIVPGIAVPIGAGPSRNDYGVILYLSFEHRFKKERK
ncbi:MAG TPA: transporter [Blastocatellia bacterium]|nr:transporter [Blastocatellia bacterium]